MVWRLFESRSFAPSAVHPHFCRKLHWLSNPQNGTVIISKSKDIFTNLALEEWICKTVSFSKDCFLLLMWFNKKAIVVGRHQNPWMECRLNQCIDNEVAISRRQSGGGTVYHDLNNLNLSFFSNKRTYNRKNNLVFIKNVLESCYNIPCEISHREDLILSDGHHKISGTASKLTSETAYHHCTLLVDVNLSDMRSVIRKEKLDIECKATSSVRSSVKNLKSVNPSVDIVSLMWNLAEAFKIKHMNTSPMVELTPTESTFKGLDSLVENLTSWNWIYGKTPRFKLPVFLESGSIKFCEITVYHGVIENVFYFMNNFESKPCLESLRFSPEEIERALKEWVLLEGSDFSKCVYASVYKAVVNLWK